MNNIDNQIIIKNLEKLVKIQFNTKQYEKEEWTEAFNVLEMFKDIIKANKKTTILKTTKALDLYLKQWIFWWYKIKSYLTEQQQKYMSDIYWQVRNYLVIKRGQIYKDYWNIIKQIQQIQKDKILKFIKPNNKYSIVNKYINEVILLLRNPWKVWLYEESEKNTLKAEITYTLSLAKKFSKDKFFWKNQFLEKNIEEIKQLINKEI